MQLGYLEQPISRAEVAIAFISWYISSYVILTFPESFYRYGYIVFSVAFLFVMMQWRYFFSLLIYLSLYVPLYPYIGSVFFLLPLLIIPTLANMENYMIRLAKWMDERKKISQSSDFIDEEFFKPYLMEN